MDPRPSVIVQNVSASDGADSGNAPAGTSATLSATNVRAAEPDLDLEAQGTRHAQADSHSHDHGQGQLSSSHERQPSSNQVPSRKYVPPRRRPEVMASNYTPTVGSPSLSLALRQTAISSDPQHRSQAERASYGGSLSQHTSMPGNSSISGISTSSSAWGDRQYQQSYVRPPHTPGGRRNYGASNSSASSSYTNAVSARMAGEASSSLNRQGRALEADGALVPGAVDFDDDNYSVVSGRTNSLLRNRTAHFAERQELRNVPLEEVGPLIITMATI